MSQTRRHEVAVVGVTPSLQSRAPVHLVTMHSSKVNMVVVKRPRSTPRWHHCVPTIALGVTPVVIDREVVVEAAKDGHDARDDWHVLVPPGTAAVKLRRRVTLYVVSAAK